MVRVVFINIEQTRTALIAGAFDRFILDEITILVILRDMVEAAFPAGYGMDLLV